MLAEHFEKACETPIGDIVWFPDRTWAHLRSRHRTAADGGEWFGYVSYTREHEGAQAADFAAEADFTEETADENPDWTLDLRRRDRPLARQRGAPRDHHARLGRFAGVRRSGATAELGPDTTDQCTLVDNRFTFVSLDAFTGDYVEVRLYGKRGDELARESLYEDE